LPPLCRPKGIKNRADNRAELPRLEVVSDETLWHLPQRRDLKEEQQLVNAQVGDVEFDGIEIREEKVTDLASFIHGTTVSELASSSIAAAASAGHCQRVCPQNQQAT